MRSLQKAPISAITIVMSRRAEAMEGNDESPLGWASAGQRWMNGSGVFLRAHDGGGMWDCSPIANGPLGIVYIN